MNIGEGKQINQKYTSDICKYILTCVHFNTEQTLNFSDCLWTRKLIGYLLWPFGEKLISKLLTQVNTGKFTVFLVLFEY